MWTSTNAKQCSTNKHIRKIVELTNILKSNNQLDHDEWKGVEIKLLNINVFHAND